jgi:hypothetical protein
VRFRVQTPVLEREREEEERKRRRWERGKKNEGNLRMTL